MPEPDASSDVQGVPVWRYEIPAHLGGVISWWETASASDALRTLHVAHRMDAKAQATRREALLAAFFCEEDVDRMLDLLGLAS